MNAGLELRYHSILCQVGFSFLFYDLYHFIKATNTVVIVTSQGPHHYHTITSILIDLSLEHHYGIRNIKEIILDKSAECFVGQLFCDSSRTFKIQEHEYA